MGYLFSGGRLVGDGLRYGLCCTGCYSKYCNADLTASPRVARVEHALPYPVADSKRHVDFGLFEKTRGKMVFSLRYSRFSFLVSFCWLRSSR